MYRFCALNEKKIDTLMGRPLTCAARGNHPPPRHYAAAYSFGYVKQQKRMTSDKDITTIKTVTLLWYAVQRHTEILPKLQQISRLMLLDFQCTFIVHSKNRDLHLDCVSELSFYFYLHG